MVALASLVLAGYYLGESGRFLYPEPGERAEYNPLEQVRPELESPCEFSIQLQSSTRRLEGTNHLLLLLQVYSHAATSSRLSQCFVLRSQGESHPHR